MHIPEEQKARDCKGVPWCLADMLKLLWRERKRRAPTAEGETLPRLGCSGEGDTLCVTGGKGELGRAQQGEAGKYGQVVKDPIRC